MKRKRIYAILMVAIMALTSGCGNTEDTNKTDASVAESSTSETMETGKVGVAEKETAESESSVSESDDIDSKITEKDDSELDLKGYYYGMEDRTVCNNGENIFGSVIYNGTDFTGYVTTSKVPIYAENDVKMGYVKEGVDIIISGGYVGWCQFDLDGENRYARLSDIEANSIIMDERDAMVAAEEANKQEQASARGETPVPPEQSEQIVPVETEPVESDKYTPEEAIAVYRGLMEAGGITWSPEIKDVVSWGTGWLYLDKGQPESAAGSSLESFAIGGHSWTKFYIEVTGSDDECVYYTMWVC
ncbi:MAG: hypothetical protein HFI07_08585 [Lachnospiraceae bacterium]|nr:hypothetical protein [Lachnospiraceae bacterium]